MLQLIDEMSATITTLAAKGLRKKRERKKQQKVLQVKLPDSYEYVKTCIIMATCARHMANGA